MYCGLAGAVAPAGVFGKLRQLVCRLPHRGHNYNRLPIKMRFYGSG
jgi:hypothetical protein